MAKKKNDNNNAQQQKNEHNCWFFSCAHKNDINGGGGEKEAKKKEGGGSGDSKKGGNSSDGSIVLKIEMHSEGCESKVLKLTRAFEGVESVKADKESNKLTVTGKVDPAEIRDFLQQKTKKKVDLISPLPKKEDSNKKDQNNDSSENKPQEASVTTAVIKVAFHCLGCVEKICKIVSKTKGVHDMTIDKQKETVTVKGTMDVKALTQTLNNKLKRPVEVVPPKKEKGGDQKEKDGDSNKSGGSGGKKKKGGSEGHENGGDGEGEVAIAKTEGNMIEYMEQPGLGYGPGPMPGYRYMGQPMPTYGNGCVWEPVPVYGGMAPGPHVPVYEYGHGYGNVEVPDYPMHMKFNDENPNACSVM